MAGPFKFKQFRVEQDRCAMKIGTDAVLLGAWASLAHNPESILDIGTGTGVIALMLAQRSEAPLIDALEIDEDAYEQAVENFENSPWGDRLFCYHADFEEFVDEMHQEQQYDLLVSNPPFYSEDHFPEDSQRTQARFAFSLPLDTLLTGAEKLLTPEGRLNLILPAKEESSVIDLAATHGLFPCRLTRVQGNSDVRPKRILLELGRMRKEFFTQSLVIEKGRHQYTKAYQELTSEFYLRM